MRHDADISTQDPAGVKDRFPCPECRRETTHSLLSVVNSRHFEGDGMVQFLENYLTVRCDGCGTISFSRVSRCTGNERGHPSYKSGSQRNELGHPSFKEILETLGRGCIPGEILCDERFDFPAYRLYFNSEGVTMREH